MVTAPHLAGTTAKSSRFPTSVNPFGNDLDAARDRKLMKGVAEGDGEAFARLFQQHAPTAMALAHRIIRQRHLAEEAVQETFLAVWRHPHRYLADRGSVRSWIMSIAHYRAVDVVRRESSQFKRATEAGAEDPTDRPEDPGEVAVRRIGLADERTALRQVIKLLPPEQLQILELMYFGGLSQTRIAERLSIPLGTVKSRARLAMLRLRPELVGLER